MLPQPASVENIRGAKSRAGLKPPIETGAKREMRTVKVMPMAKGITQAGRILPRLSVSVKTTRAKRVVPSSSDRNH